MKLATILLLLLCPFFVFSQEKVEGPIGSITGIVKDSANDYGLQSVTVLVYKKSDSTLLSYQLTNTSGEFNFVKMPLDVTLLVSLSYSGYKPFSKTIKLDSIRPSYKFDTIQLTAGFKNLEEVVIEAVLPIRMNGDTLEINPAAFKMDSNAVVEDMLRKVPGVTLWGDGTVTVNGKQVTNVYVDGKPFFGNDPTIATQNLPKNAIDKIQVYTEEDRTKSPGERTPSDSLLTMNIKLKADKKNGYFGKGGAGIGTDKRFEADLGLQAYNKKTRLGIGGSFNNLNKNVDDLQSLLGETTFRSQNPRNRYVANFSGRGINKFYFLGANLQHSFIESTNNQRTNQLTFDVTGRGNINYLNSQSENKSAGSNTLFNSSSGNSTQENDTKTLAVSYEKRDVDRDINLRASVSDSRGNGSSTSSTTSESAEKGLLSQGNSSSESETKSNNINLSANFLNKDSDERNLKSFSIRYNTNYSESESVRTTLSNFESFSRPSDNRYNNRLYNTNSNNWGNSLNVSYNALKRLLFGSNNLWDINIRLTNNLSMNQSDMINNVSDFDSINKVYLTNTEITTVQKNNRLSEEPSLNLSKSFSKRLSNRYFRTFSISTNLGGQFLWERDQSNFSKRNLSRDFSFFTPNSNLNYYYQKNNGYNINASLNHGISYAIPSVDQLFPIIDTVSNSYSFNNGGKFLTPSKSNNFGFNFNYNRGNNRNKKADINFNLNASYGIVKNGITDSSFYDKSGRRVIYLINIDGRKNWGLSGNVNTSIRLKKNVLQFTYNGSLFNSQSPNYIDSLFSISRTQNMNNSLRIYFALGEIVNFSMSQGVNMSNSLQTAKKLGSFKNTNYVTTANINLLYPKNMTFSNTLNYVKNTSNKQSSALWNAFLSYRFLKGKQLEAKVSAMDILRQNKNIGIGSSNNGITTTVTNGLQQFYMLTLSYFPRKFGVGPGGGGRRGGTPGGGGGGMGRPAGGGRGNQ
jgi:hypothetical protein